MSILSRFTSARHLDDTAMAEIWAAATAEGSTPSHPHFGDCAHCRARFAAFLGWLDEVRSDALGEADATLSTERLAAQHAQILRRLEALEKPARIIAFPIVPRGLRVVRPFTQRWVATAAAAGLVVGLAVGQLLDLGRAPAPESAAGGVESVALQANAGRRGAVQPVSATVVEDEALFYGDGELDASVRGVRYAPLHLFDDVTPRARDLER